MYTIISFPLLLIGVSCWPSWKSSSIFSSIPIFFSSYHKEIYFYQLPTAVIDAVLKLWKLWEKKNTTEYFLLPWNVKQTFNGNEIMV